MALLTFPLPLSGFFDLLPVARCRLDLPEIADVSRTSGGEILTADLATALWRGKLDLAAMLHDEASAIRPLINLLRRPGASFLVSDLTRPWPRMDPQGLLLAGATPVILAIGGSGRELSLSGLPAWYPVSAGDLLSFSYGSSPTRYALHEVVSGGQAGVTGQTGLIEVTPPIRPGAAAGAAIQLVWPRCKAVLVPGSANPGTSQNTVTTEASLEWQQTLR